MSILRFQRRQGGQWGRAPESGAVVPLGRGGRGFRGVVVQVGAQANSAQSRGAGAAGALDHGELERRLLEIGFVEGARVEILHEGAIGRDPIGVRLDDMRVALRRREADAILVRIEDGAPAFVEAAE